MRYIRLILSLVITQLAGVVGSFFTAESISTWYVFLEKPFFTPPNWVFGPVWITLYLLMGISLYMTWEHKKTYFWVQLGLNALWSILFFGLKEPFLALVEIVILWVFIALTITDFWTISKKAAYLLMPYLAWVTYAAALNLGIVFLNP